MPQYKVLIGIGTTPLGSTEAYITPNVSGTNAANLVQQLLDKRFTFLKSDLQIAGVRISDTAVKRSSQLLLPGDWIWPEKPGSLHISDSGRFSGNTLSDKLIPYDNALQLRVGYGTLGRFANKYLVGVPKGAVGIEPGNMVRGSPAWYWAGVDDFTAFLVLNGFLVRARRQDTGFAPQDVHLVVLPAPQPGPIAVVVANNAFPTLAVGTKLQWSGARFKKIFAGTPNGTWKVSAINQAYSATEWALTLDGSDQMSPGQFKQYGTLQLIGYSLQAITSVQAQRIAEHQRGGPFTRPHGRRRTRVLLDP